MRILPVLALVVVALAFAGCPSADNGDDDDDDDGRCVFAAPVQTSMTSFPDSAEPGTLGCGIDTLTSGITRWAAVGPTLFAGSAMCGACLEVTGSAGTELVQVVGICPGCEVNGIAALDVNSSGSVAISGSASGIATVSWRQVPCDGATTVRFTMEGANPFYAKLRVLDTRTPLLEVAMAVGTSSATMTRTADNAWELTSPQPGAGPYELDLTDAFGEQITQTGVPLMSNGTSFAGSVQFSPCE